MIFRQSKYNDTDMLHSGLQDTFIKCGISKIYRLFTGEHKTIPLDHILQRKENTFVVHFNDTLFQI